ncbi:MAG: hypothetical protein H7A24_09125 [Leptospiraceae bacterium]|nr:hypothetical protein [Leptospiraceae bacterium]MCP5512031.1 hypothetical protein [Leptospiraceae bacterium]
MYKYILFLYSIILQIFLILPFPTFSESIGFVYFDSNIGQSSGGHSALKIGEMAYHFQLYPDQIFHIVREPWKEIRYIYNSIDNRNIKIRNILLSPDSFHSIKDHFDEIYLLQKNELEVLNYLKLDTEILNQNPDRGVSIPTLGYFPEENLSPEEFILKYENHSGLKFFLNTYTELKNLHYPARRKGEEYLFNTDNIFSFRFIDLISRYSFLFHLINDSDVKVDSYFCADTYLSESEKKDLLKKWEAILPILRSNLLSNPENWKFRSGKNLLIELVRMKLIEKSIHEKKVYLPDVYPGNYSFISKETLKVNNSYEKLRNQVLLIFQTNLKKYLNNNNHSDNEQLLLEDSVNRIHEFYNSQDVIRTSFQKMLPLRPGKRNFKKIFQSDFLSNHSNESSLIYDEYLKKLRSKYSFDLITKNCTTEIFSNLPYDQSKNPDILAKDLGGRIKGSEPFVFIPFYAYYQTGKVFRSTYPISIESVRRRYKTKASFRENPIWVALKESNTISSKIYEFNDEDHIFLFFTDDVLLLRPAFGILNLGSGLSQTLFGVVYSPVDRGTNLKKGLEGMLFSIPELFFFNIRKGKILYEEDFKNIFLSEKNSDLENVK